jgi:NADH-quinone oxidoreductase subunit L
MLILLAVVPLTFAALLALFMAEWKPGPIRYIALLASLLSLVIVISASMSPASGQSLTWFSLASYSFSLTTSTAPLNMLLLFMVAIMTPLVIVYSIGFMRVPSEQGRYYFGLCLFSAAMMLFSIAGDFLTMLIGWELLGIASYLLIGFWYNKDGAPSAARKAITTVLIGDVLMLMAIVIVWNSYHTFVFSSIIGPVSTPMQVALLLILIAAFTKSAQFPFHEWLPDAMEGPTPISAFLHSSTMVKAGVFLVIVLMPLFLAYNLLGIMLAVGILTAVLGATNAIAESNIKRILAYSTIEDLGLMFVALGLHAMMAALMLFLVQTFYKALLFMSAGAIMKANDNEESIDRMESYTAGRALLVAMAIGALSMAGIVPLSGFFGKIGVESSANNVLVYAVLVAIGFASSIYTFRWLFIPLRKSSDQTRTTRINFELIPRAMLVPIYTLAALAVAGSLAYVYLPAYLGYTQIALTPVSVIVETAVALAGLALAYLFYLKRGADGLQTSHKLVYASLYNGVIVNHFYGLAAKSLAMLSSAADMLNYELYRFVRALVGSVLGLAELVRRIENGKMNAYMIVFIIGILVVLAMLAL